jgi:creatinine amidohydrolase/Fe(II)-dependent formamide hydrolase-like protein
MKGTGRKASPKMPRFEVTAHPERYFPTGVIGDPTEASSQKGRMINRYVVAKVTKLVEQLKSCQDS